MMMMMNRSERVVCDTTWQPRFRVSDNLYEEEEEEEIYLAQTQQIKCKYKSYTIQLSRVTGKPEGQLCRPP